MDECDIPADDDDAEDDDDNDDALGPFVVGGSPLLCELLLCPLLLLRPLLLIGCGSTRLNETGWMPFCLGETMASW